MGSALAVPSDKTVAIFEVTGGVHRGVAAPVAGSTLRVGAGGDSDIVLSDDGVAEDHAVLRFERGGVLIEAHGAEVGLGRHLVPRGQACRTRLPADIRIGDCAIRLNRPEGRSGWLQRPVAAAIGCLALVGALVAASQADAIKAAASGDETGQTAAAAPAPAIDLAPNASNAPAVDPMAALRERVAEARIEGLRIEADGDRIVARGLLDETGRQRWAATQRWFDQSFSGRYVLASEVGAKSAATMPRFQVQAIWFGASPYVVTADGQRRSTGATLGDGWVIKDIKDGRLTVAKSGEEVSLNF